MAHRALTLKYRPQVFTDMVGQEHVSAVLTRALETRRVAHAYLFTGARGVGKTTSARILAKALNCETRAELLAQGKPPPPDPCNTCTSCLEITSGISLDVAEIDGASNRGIEDVQQLREKVRFAPTGGRYRVVIIDEVHQLSKDAFAALLKTLEEPPPNVVFIFATTDPQKLPETIRSRTQRFDFARVPLRKVADRLLDVAAREAKDPEGLRFTLTEGAAILIAHKSEGSIRDAVSALDQVVSAGEPEVNEELARRVLGIADREVFFAIAEAVVTHVPKTALQALHAAFDKGLDARDIAEGLAEHFRHLLILKVDPESTDLVAASTEDLERLRAQGAGWTEHDLLRLLRIASDALWPMRDSPQPLLHVEAAVMQMATLEPGETLAELLARLEALEARLAGGAAPAGPARGPTGTTARPAFGSAPGSAPPTRSAAPEPVRRATPGGAAPTASSRPAPPGAPRANAYAPNAPATRPPASTSNTLVSNTTARAPAPMRRPAPAATPASVALADEPLDRSAGVLQQWAAFVSTVRARKPLLGAFLEESRFLGRAHDRFVLATDDLHRVVIEESGNRAILDETLKRTFGDALGLQCVPADAAPMRDDVPEDDPEANPPVPDPNGLVLEAQTPPVAPAAVREATPEKPVFKRPEARTREGEDVAGMVEKTIAWFDGEAISPDRRTNPRAEG